MWLKDTECELEILDVLRYSRGLFQKNTAKRLFSVLSCRLSGESEFVCREQTLHADASHYLFIPSNTEYTQASMGEEIICIHMHITGVEQEGIGVINCQSAQVRQSFLTLYTLWQEKRAGYYLKCKSIVFDILAEFVALTEPHGLQNAQALIAPSMEEIHRTFYHSDFSLNDAITLSHVSQAYFRRLFHAVYGEPPVSYVNKLRVERAKSLLLGRTDSLRQISEACGFLNEKYFYAVFRKITGYTPSEWLALHG